MQELAQDVEAVVLGFLVLFLLDQNVEMQKVDGTGQVGVQVTLGARLPFQEVEQA